MQARQATHARSRQFSIGERVRLPSEEMAVVTHEPREVNGALRVELRYLRNGAGDVLLPVELVQRTR